MNKNSIMAQSSPKRAIRRKRCHHALFKNRRRGQRTNEVGCEADRIALLRIAQEADNAAFPKGNAAAVASAMQYF
jgi:hypothetical protein